MIDLAQMVREYAHNPVAWVTQQLGVIPDPWQIKAFDLVVNNHNIAISAGTGCGKSAWDSWLTLWWMCTRPYAKVVVTATKMEQVTQQLWPEMHRWLRHSERVASLLEWSPTRIWMRGEKEEWCCIQRVAKVKGGEGGKQAEGMAGVHTDHLLVIADEASGIETPNIDALMGLTTHRLNKLVLTGNPLRSSGRFYDVFNIPRFAKHWATMSVGYLDSPRVDREWAIRMISQYGEDSPAVQARVFGRFPSKNATDTCFSNDSVRSAMDRTVDPDPEQMPQIGIDCSRFGSDESVITVRQGLHVFPQHIFSQVGIDFLIGKAQELAKQHAIPIETSVTPWLEVPIVCDETGLGGGLVDGLRAKGFNRVIGINFSERAIDDENYANRPSELWLKDAQRFWSEISLPNDEVLYQQLVCRKYGYSETSRCTRRIIEPKKAMRQRGLASPDRADSLMLALADIDNEDMWASVKFW